MEPGRPGAPAMYLPDLVGMVGVGAGIRIDILVPNLAGALSRLYGADLEQANTGSPKRSLKTDVTENAGVSTVGLRQSDGHCDVGVMPPPSGV